MEKLFYAQVLLAT